MCLEIFKHRNEPKHNFTFQVDPPFIFTNRVNSITLEDSNVPARTSVFVTGWGTTSVSQYLQYYVEQQLIFCQNVSN